MAFSPELDEEWECRQDPRTGVFLEDQAGVDCGWPLAGMEPGSQRPEWTGVDRTGGDSGLCPLCEANFSLYNT
jgi:hypothetical protein